MREEAKQKRLDELTKFRERFGDYWYYPDGDVYVPIEMMRVPCVDGVNYVMVISLESDTPRLARSLVGGSGGDMSVEQYHDLKKNYSKQSIIVMEYM